MVRKTVGLPENVLSCLPIIGNPLFAIAGILVADLKQVFADDLILSKALVELLVQMEERLWLEVCRRKPITERWLEPELHSFKIVSSNIRIGAQHKVGFTLG